MLSFARWQSYAAVGSRDFLQERTLHRPIRTGIIKALALTNCISVLSCCGVCVCYVFFIGTV